MSYEVLGVVVVVAVLVIAVVLYLQHKGRYLDPRPPVPVPQNPSACAPPPDRAGDVLKGVYRPQRLQVLAECAVAEGVAAEVRHELDGDVHIRLKPDPKYAPLARQGQDFIVCEIIPPDQATVKEPQVGQHIHVEGPWCFDRIHGWNEIHPVWKLEPLTN